MRLALILLLSSMCFGQNSAPTSIAVDSQPAVSNQATASVRAQDNIRHIADRVCFSGGATTAPSLTQLTVVLRDGATGAGTVLATFVVVVPASTGQNVAPFCADMGVQGSNNTAMTAEWSALLTNEFEQVTLLLPQPDKLRGNMPRKEDIPANASIAAQSWLTGKTITGVNVWKHGSVTVIEIAYSGGTSFIKERQGVIEYGGTADFGTGTIAV